MVERFLSEDESVVSRFNNYHLTQDRVIRLIESKKEADYQDIQLEHIASFDYDKNFNWSLLRGGVLTILGGLMTVFVNQIPQVITQTIVIAGFLAVLIAYLTVSRNYLIHSDAGKSMKLPDSKNTTEFWQSINQQKNHS